MQVPDEPTTPHLLRLMEGERQDTGAGGGAGGAGGEERDPQRTLFQTTPPRSPRQQQQQQHRPLTTAGVAAAAALQAPASGTVLVTYLPVWAGALASVSTAAGATVEVATIVLPFVLYLWYVRT